jgi:sigma-54 dependent transcriptional regulator, acetoin dehydrogenase operon transcriptional activator AcoR
MIAFQSHNARIRKAVESYAPESYVKSYIKASWDRCCTQYKLDPSLPAELHVVEHQELLSRQEQLANILHAAKTEMSTLYQQIAKAGYAIMLTDCEGVLLNYFGDPEFTHAASKSGLLPGAVWSERFQGTNGMGTCLVDQRPMIVHHDDHFLFRNTGLTCAAAPILDWHGKILAVLDASGESHQAPLHVLDLVKMSVNEIENQIFINEYHDNRLLLFHARSEFVNTLNKGIIALDAYDKVLAVSRNALAQLGIPSSSVIGQPLEAIFNLKFESLLRALQKNSSLPIMVFDAQQGRRFFASALTANFCLKPSSSLFEKASESEPVPINSGKKPNDLKTPLERLQFDRDKTMAHNISNALRVMDRDIPILLRGETGTGKEMFAKAIHLSGIRAHQPFVAINCASIPEALIESELFGYKSGAFTGANREGSRGKILQSNGGTLFLDEIGDMPVALQVRLLRVLEEREVAPLGSTAAIKLNLHVISATHCDLLEKIAKKEFREDLYYRIQGLTLTLPPLRERTDRKALIGFLLDHEQADDDNVTIDEALLLALDRHRWPGNIRQLRNVLRTMLALRNSDILTIDCLPPDLFDSKDINKSPTASSEVNNNLNPLESAERSALIHELNLAHWNVSKLAKQLKVSRNTLYRKLDRLGIKTLALKNHQLN